MSVNKKVIVAGGVFVISMVTPMVADAAATTVNSASTAQTVSVAASAAGGYVVEAFNLNLSAHTALSYDGNTTAVGVKSGSSKGMHSFGGSSGGGAVKACETGSIATPNASTASVTITAGC